MTGGAQPSRFDRILDWSSTFPTALQAQRTSLTVISQAANANAHAAEKKDKSIRVCVLPYLVAFHSAYSDTHHLLSTGCAEEEIYQQRQYNTEHQTENTHQHTDSAQRYGHTV